MNKLIKKAARRLSSKVKTDADFQDTVEQIAKYMTRDKLMPAFLNERLEIDPVQVFRVLQLTNGMSAPTKRD